MKCSKCGTENTGPQSRFCKECGTPLAAVQKTSGDPSSKRLCDGCMGAFSQSDLAVLDGQELCTLCMARERRRTEIRAPQALVQAPLPGPPPPGPAGSAPRGYYYGPETARKTSGWAIASIIMAFFLPLIGVIAGIVALKQIKRRPDELEGKGIAIAGIVLGSLSTVMAACIVGIVVLSVVVAVDMVKKDEEEKRAYEVVAGIVASEAAYYLKYGRHGDLDELTADGLLARGSAGAAGAYDFSVEVTEDGEDFAVRAKPRNAKTGGHLYADKAGRVTYDALKPAGPQSIPFQQRMPGFNMQGRQKPVRIQPPSTSG